MKKTIFALAILFTTPAFAEVSYLEEARQLGALSGMGKACQAKKSETFDMLSHAIILSKATDAHSRDSALRAFVDEKVKLYMQTKSSCSAVLKVFDTQDIFKIKLYQDGTLIMPDGTKVVPTIPYDATKI